jgi:hypothetical protein
MKLSQESKQQGTLPSPPTTSFLISSSYSFLLALEREKSELVIGGGNLLKDTPRPPASAPVYKIYYFKVCDVRWRGFAERHLQIF